MSFHINTNRQNPASWIRIFQTFISLIFLGIMAINGQPALAQESKMMVRIAEIEIFPEFLEDYKSILKEEAAASIKLERGVISIFPMYQKENPTYIRILEIYADKASYEHHLKTPHFQKYKTTTVKMVKSLKLVDMGVIDASTLPLLFKKINE